MSALDGVQAAVVDAAARLHERHGDRFTMAQLEAGSGVSRATIYRRIGGKHDVLAQLADHRGIDVDADDARTRILRAAGTVVGVHGLRSATIEQIAAEADVGVATVYRHFGGKEQLLRAVMDELLPRLAVRDAAAHATADVATDLAQIVGAMVTAFTANRDLMRWVLLGGEAERAYIDELRDPADSTFDGLTAWFATQIDAGRLHADARPDELALALIGMGIGMAIVGPLRFPQAQTDPQRTASVILGLLGAGLTGHGR